VDALVKLEYEFIEEYLLSSSQFGVCNDRKRYYIGAKRTSSTAKPVKSVAEIKLHYSLDSFMDASHTHKICPLSHYLEDLQDPTPYLVPELFITKRPTFRFDLVSPDSEMTACFTKSYGTKHVFNGGSILKTTKLKVL
jgi:tRNA (cytosine38-C5)-methyltransferase